MPQGDERPTSPIPPTDAGTPGSGAGSAYLSVGEKPGDQLGPYKLLSIVGEGGFGVVWLAERREPMLQRVAIKIIKPGMDSKAVIARFEQERQALAVMDHPNVARVYDGGVTPAPLGSRPFFVMEYVAGEPITVFADRRGLTLRQRLELFLPVCDAVQHAHHKGVIHRDLKPSNILVALPDGPAEDAVRRATPKVIDFGVAKAISRPMTDRTIFTETGQMIGTPEYMSPEQIGGVGSSSPADVDTRTDVYALGVVLYELLVGALPFDSGQLRSMSAAELQRAAHTMDAPRPSLRLSALGGVSTTIAEYRRISPAELRTQLRRELEWIPLKAMRRDREERYPTPADLGADIRNYLEGRALVAGPETTTYRVRAFVRRNRGLVTGGALLASVLIAGVVGTTSGYVRAARRAESEAAARAQADAQRARAESVRDFIVKTLQSSDPESSGRQDMLVSEAMQRAVQRLDQGELAKEPDDRAQIMLVISSILRNAGKHAPAEGLARQALELARSTHAGDHALVAEAMRHVGASLVAGGRDTEAESLARQSLAMFERLGSGHEREVATALGEMSVIMAALGRTDEAVEFSNRAVALAERALPASDELIRGLRQNLAVALEGSGRLDRAGPLYERMLEDQRLAHPQAHPELASSMVDLAQFYDRAGRFPESEKLLTEALAMWRTLYAGDHPTIARTLNSLAGVRQGLGRSEAALRMYREALAMRERLYTGDHPEIASVLSNLGTLLVEQGRFDEAMTVQRRCLDMRRRLFKGDHPDIALAMNNLGSLLSALGKPDEALAMHEDTLAMRRRLFTGDHPDVAASLSNLAFACNSLGQLERAEGLMSESLAMYKRLYPEGGANIARLVHNLGAIKRNLGKLPEAEALLREAVETRSRLFPDGHWETVMSLSSLAACEDLMNKPDEAERLYTAARTLGDKVWPATHPDRGWVEYKWAEFLHKHGRTAEALAPASRARAIAEESLPENHPDRAEITNFADKIGAK